MKNYAIVFTIILWMSLPFSGNAQTLKQILQDGPITQVYHDSNGKIKSAMGMAFIHATQEEVWNVLIDFEQYPDFMPNYTYSKIIKTKGNIIETKHKVRVPGPDLKYINRYILDKAKYILKIQQIGGDKEEIEYFEVTPYHDGVLLKYYINITLPKYIAKFEGSEQSVTRGVNASITLGAMHFFKMRVEELQKRK